MGKYAIVGLLLFAAFDTIREYKHGFVFDISRVFVWGAMGFTVGMIFYWIWHW